MKNSFAAFALVLTLALIAAGQKPGAPKLDPIPSSEVQRELIRQGVALHDKEDYDGAIRTYQSVLRENPGSVEALYELAFSFFKRKDWTNCLETAKKGTQYRSDLLPGFYVQLGNCLDELGKPKDAIDTFKAGIKLSPKSHLLQYNLAVTYHRQGKLDESRSAAKQAALLNPTHPSSQFLLTVLFDRGAYKTPALLAACRFLVLEPSSPRSQIALGIVTKIMQAGVSPGKEENEINVFVDMSPQKKDEGDFSSLDLVLGLVKAGNYSEKNKGKPETVLLAENFSTLFAILTESSGSKNRSQFTWKYYLPYFNEMTKKGHMEAFVNYTHQRSTMTGVREWLMQNQDKVTDFLAWSKGYVWAKADLK